MLPQCNSFFTDEELVPCPSSLFSSDGRSRERSSLKFVKGFYGTVRYDNFWSRGPRDS